MYNMMTIVKNIVLYIWKLQRLNFLSSHHKKKIVNYVWDIILTKFIVVITLQYVHILSYVIHLKLYVNKFFININLFYVAIKTFYYHYQIKLEIKIKITKNIFS